MKTESMEVITTTRIEGAEYALKNTFFDVVLADIRLTGVQRREGLELLRYVQEKSPGTRVIIMTAHGSPEIEQEAYEKGASWYFEKPFDLRVLIERMKEVAMG